MAKLDAADRNALPAKAFAGPDRSYPVPDRSHAANAKARASQMHGRGLISDKELAKINAKADKVLGASKKSDGDADDKEDGPAAGMPPLKSIQMTATERKAQQKRFSEAQPYVDDGGVTMHLDHDHLTKMGVGGNLKSGQKVRIGGMGEVRSSETRSDNGGDRHSATVRLTHMGVAPHGKGGKKAIG